MLWKYSKCFVRGHQKKFDELENQIKDLEKKKEQIEENDKQVKAAYIRYNDTDPVPGSYRSRVQCDRCDWVCT